MKMDGLNTYDPTQIQDNESKFNLNCYNKNGRLAGYNYKTDFDIPMLPIYQREYTSNYFEGEGKDSVIPGSPRFIHENSTDELVSGLVKPDVSLFLDTTKFDTGINSNYLRKAAEFNSDYYTGILNESVKSIIGDELYNAMLNFGVDCEVYSDVEVAVSYSGPYGESGLTKFRITSNMLHFFTVVHGADAYKNNPNYEYVNVYVKYAAYTELQLLHRIEIDDLLAATDRNINITTDTLDKQFYMTYNTDELGYLDVQTDTSEYKPLIDIDPTNALINKDKNLSSIIYSGLFQFEDELLVNPSWFVSQTVVSTSPLVDTETHTYISSEDYDLESSINEYLDSIISLNDSVANSVNDTPLITSDFMIEKYIENNDSDIFGLYLNDNKLKLTARAWPTTTGGTLKYYTKTINDEFQTNASIYGATMGWLSEGNSYAVDSNRKCDTVDLYNGEFSVGDEPGTLNQRDAGEFLIQYLLRDGTNSPALVNTSLVTFVEFKYFTLHFDDIVSETIDEGKEWQIDIWAKSNDVGDIYYRVMSIDITSAYNAFVAAAGGTYTIANEESLMQDSIRLSYSNIGTSGDHYSRLLPLRDFGCTYNTETGKRGLFVVMNVGTILDEVDTYTVGTYGIDDVANYLPLSNNINSTDDISDIMYDPDGRFQDDYSSFKSGLLNRPEQSSPQWDLDANHLEEYDGRLFMSSRERRDSITPLLTLLDIVSTLPDNPSNDDVYAVDDNSTDVKFYVYLNEWVELTGAFDDKPFLNLADSLYYQYKTDPVNRTELVEYTEYYTQYKDLYYSQQGYPEVVLETNYKGYSNIITGLKSFINQLYVFQDKEIHVIRKSLTREVSGILEPTYQFDKSFDKGSIEWTIGEYEKKLYFTNEDGIFYIDSGGNYNKVSGKINNLFDLGYITPETVNYASIKDDFYIVKLSETIPFSIFSKLQVPYAYTRNLYCEYIAYHIPTDSFWMGNDATGSSRWFYMSKDFTMRNKYESEFVVKQNKRISFSYEDGKFTVIQIRNGFSKIGEINYNGNSSGMPVRHTLNGARCASYSFLISSEFLTKMRDFMLIENGK